MNREIREACLGLPAHQQPLSKEIWQRMVTNIPILRMNLLKILIDVPEGGKETP